MLVANQMISSLPKKYLFAAHSALLSNLLRFSPHARHKPNDFFVTEEIFVCCAFGSIVKMLRFSPYARRKPNDFFVAEEIFVCCAFGSIVKMLRFFASCSSLLILLKCIRYSIKHFFIKMLCNKLHSYWHTFFIFSARN